MYAGGVETDVYIAMGVRWGCRDGCVHSYEYAGGFKMDVYIAMGVRWGFQDGCVHSYGCTLGVSRWMCT